MKEKINFLVSNKGDLIVPNFSEIITEIEIRNGRNFTLIKKL